MQDYDDITKTSVPKFYIDRELTPLTPVPRLINGEALVPLHAFSQAVGAKVKTFEGSEKLTICKGDLRIPLDVSGADSVSIDGVVYASLAAFADVLGLRWQMADDTLSVTSSVIDHTGLCVGDRPPDFTLPDLYTGERVSLKDYQGKKTVFFMWGTW